jgi:phosphoheptose isomerase
MHKTLEALVRKYPDLSPCVDDVQRAYDLLYACYSNKGKVLICGNGGSAADCEHMTGELMKGYLLRREIMGLERKTLLETLDAELVDKLQHTLPAISLVSQSGLITAITNDTASDMIFAQQVFGYASSGDVVIGISTSGNAANVINALQVGRALGAKTLGLSGQTGGKMREHCDVCVCVPYTTVTEIQERHLPVYHALCAMLESEFFGAPN